MNTSVLNISERNIQQFKFQSQHFHKVLSVVSGRPEMKGTKALDRYSRMLGFDNFNHTHQYLARQTKLIKSIPFPPKHIIFQECPDYPDKETLEKVNLFYTYHFFAPEFLPNNRTIFNASLRKMDSFTQFPIRTDLVLWLNGDKLAVELARYLRASDLMEKQLCGIFMVYFDFYQHDLISGFDFQDVLDLLDPAKFMVSLQLYKTELTANHGLFSTAGDCHSKMVDFCNVQDLKNHQTFYFEQFNIISKRPLSIVPPKETLFDRVYTHLTQR